MVDGAQPVPAGGVDVIVSGSSSRIQQIATRHGARVKKALKTGAVLNLSARTLSSIASDHEVPSISSDALMRSQLSIATESTGAAAAWAGQIAALGAVTGRGVGVAIIDSGVDAHTALSGRIAASVDFTGSNGAGGDHYGHGTHVAGIVAAGVPRNDTGEAPVGMAPGAHIVSVKVLGADGTGRASAVIEGIDWAIENRARFGLRIVNLSLGTAPLQSWRDDPVC